MVGGSAVWVLGRTAIHVGASGLVFGYFGYLVANGWFDRRPLSILAAIAVVVLYGGLVFGVLPTQSFVSWEAHLFGLIAGVVSAWLMSCLLYTSPSPRDATLSRMPSSA